MRFRSGELENANLPRIVQSTRRAISRSKFGHVLVLGAIDISFNVFNNDEGTFQLHLYLLINEPYSEELANAVRKAFRKEPTALRPFSIAPVQKGEFFKALTYAYKNSFYRRSAYVEKRRKRDGSPRTNVQSQRLSKRPARDLDQLLLPLNVGCRLILRNAQRVRPKWRLHLKVPLLPRSKR
jgi:hypothetical protein